MSMLNSTLRAAITYLSGADKDGVRQEFASVCPKSIDLGYLIVKS